VSAATPLPETTYPEQQELIGEPAAVAESQPPAIDPYTRDVMASRHRAGDSVADLADDYGIPAEQVQAAVEQAPPTKRERWAALEPTEQEPRSVRRRHRWEETSKGPARSEIAYFCQCRRCGVQGRKVLTRGGRSLRLEVLPDGATTWTSEISECPGVQVDLCEVADVLTGRTIELEHQVEELRRETEGLHKEIDIRGGLLDRVKVATGETWWHGAVERVEQLQAVATDPLKGSYRALVADWHRKAQEADHWQVKYERQARHSKRVEGERNRASDLLSLVQAERATLREERRQIQWGSLSLADQAEAELEGLKRELAAAKAQSPTRQRRVPPPERQSTTKRFDVAGTHGYLTVGHYPTGEPCELFILIAKEGSTIRGLLDGWARIFSISLQHGVPLADLVEKSKGARFEPSGWTDDPEITPASSILDYVVRWVERRYLPAPKAEAQPTAGEQP
jgi:hypothetical protein